jgi:4-amino-4-deoxy-L-arabinose transferase-like glycosyltransferase
MALGLGLLSRGACLGLVEYRYDVGDGATYLATARTLHDHGVYSIDTTPPFVPTAYRPPGYTAFLACVQVFGDSVGAVVAVQLLVSLLTIALLVLLANRFAPESTWVVALIAALNPFDAVYAGAALSETLTSVLLMAAALALALGATTRRLMAAGILVGLTCLTRDIYLALVPFGAVAWLAFARAIPVRRRVVQALVVCAVSALTVIPWTIRNFEQFHKFIPVSAGRLGYSLWLGTWATNGDFTSGDARGEARQYPPEAFASDAERQVVEAATKDLALGDATLRAVFIDHLRRAPVGVVLVWLKRAPRLWLATRFDIFELNPRLFPRASQSWTIAKALLFAIDATLVVLAGMGALAAVRRRSALAWVVVPLTFTALVYLPLNSFESRYSQPMVPLLVLLSGFAISVFLNARARTP